MGSPLCGFKHPSLLPPPKKISPIFFLLETARLSLMPFVCLECCLCVCVCGIAEIFMNKNVNSKSTQDLQKNSVDVVHHLFVM